MTKPFRVYACLPVTRDLREPDEAKKLAEKAALNWVWLAFENRPRKQRLVTELPIG